MIERIDMEKMTERITVITPTIPKDYMRMRHLQPKRVLEFLPAKELIYIGNSELCDLVNEDIRNVYGELPIRALHEEELLEREGIVEYIKDFVRRNDEEMLPQVRPGWYYQQFLKMSFSKICEGEYYMSWDMDTVPLRDHDMFDENGKPYFDIKNEFSPGYFSTIESLLGLKKNTEGSFVSEHMVFKKSYMTELIDAIEHSPVPGSNAWEKITEAIDPMYITLGFSEFETYGTFVTEIYPDAYKKRRFRSLRRGSWFVNEKDLTQDDIDWLKKNFDAVTFENAQQIPDMVALFRNPKYRNNMSAAKFYETILESGYFGNYSNGRIDAGDWYAPV